MRNAMGWIVVLVMLAQGSLAVKMSSIKKWEASGNVSKLIKTTRDKNPALRIAAINSLSKLKAESAVKPLAALLNDETPQTTDASIKALISIGTDQANQHLVEALKLQSESARVLAAEALGKKKYKPATDALIKTVSDKRDPVAAASAYALGEIADPKAIPALTARTEYASYKVKLTCVTSLRNIGGEEAAKAVVPTFNHLNKQIRQVAIDTLIDLGDPALPYAYVALQSKDSLVRMSGLAIIQGLDKIPTKGREAVWYSLTESIAINRKSVNRNLALHLSQLKGETVPALIEALQFGEPVIRSTAFRTLEIIGKECTDAVVAAAETHAKPVAKKWFKGRSNWRGFPSWRIDLWAAATALNPHFVYEHQWSVMLHEKGSRAREAMVSKNFIVTREYVPALINQMTSMESATGTTINFFGIKHTLNEEIPSDQRETLKLAMATLTTFGQKAVFPLLAALNDTDPQVADASADVLGRIYDKRAIQPLLNQLEKKAAAGDELFNTPFYTALQKLGHTATDGPMLKVRPNTTYVKRIFQHTYPGIKVQRVQSGDRKIVDPASPAAFKVHYVKGRRKAGLIIQFQRTLKGDWIPRPPLPKALP